MLDRILTHVLARLRHTPLAAVVGALVGAIAALGAAIVFAGVAEDVVTHNGVATRDAVRLAWVVHHRSTALIDGARFFDLAGSVATVGVLAVASAHCCTGGGYRSRPRSPRWWPSSERARSRRC